MKSCFSLCLLAVILSGCNVIYEYYQPPAKNAQQAGVKKLAIGNAHTVARSVPTSGTVRISQIDGKDLYFEEKDFKVLVQNEILDRPDLVGVSVGLTEFHIEFIFKSEDGGGFYCKGSQLVELEAGNVYEPKVSFDENEGVFTCWIANIDSGKVISDINQGEWVKLDKADFSQVAADWVRHSSVIGYTDIHGPSEEDRTMLSSETDVEALPRDLDYDTGDNGNDSSGGSEQRSGSII